MSYRITVIADYNGTFYFGADKRSLAHKIASPVTEAKIYSSQIPYAVSARLADGRVVITTRTKARRNGWTMLRDHNNRDLSIKDRYAEILRDALSRLQYQLADTLPWGEDRSLPAGIVLRSGGEYIVVGQDLHGSTSAHFTGGIPWKDALENSPDLTWAWLFNE